MDNINIQNKLRRLFDSLAEPNYVMNNYYVDPLINKLSNSADPEISFLEKSNLLPDLLIGAMSKSETFHESAKVFIIRVLATAIRNQHHFCKIITNEVITVHLENTFRNINTANLAVSLKVAYMEVALAIVEHLCGVKWFLSTGVWRDISNLTSEKNTVFIVRQTYKFASRFLWKLNDDADEENIKVVLTHILNPLGEIDLYIAKSLTTEDEEELYKKFEPVIYILLAVIAECNPKEVSALVSILVLEYTCIKQLYLIIDRMRRDDIMILTVKLLFSLILSKVFISKPMIADQVYSNEDFMELQAMFFNTVQLHITRRKPILVIDTARTCCGIWNAMWKDQMMGNEKVDAVKVYLLNKMLFICLVPPIVYVKNVVHMPNEERVTEYLMKLLNSNCVQTARAAYLLRDLILSMDIATITLQSVKRLASIESNLNNEQANIMFQILYWILDEYDRQFDEEVKMELNYQDADNRLLIISHVMDSVYSLVKNHVIRWYESLEVICLYSMVFHLLSRPGLSCKFTVTALNVVALTMKKFLQPNLSLLLDSKPGTTIAGLGKLIVMKMSDPKWEVRDSALELLLVCIEISYIKFTPLQKQISENNLINFAATLVFNDPEFYVQMSALQCIGAASKIPVLWEQLVSEFPNIKDQLINILANSQEGTVRKEACNVLCEMYQSLKLSNEFKQTLYKYMVSAALCDFHWEVQVSALKFWKVAIQSLLTDQGMLDGTFPPVTFSKKSRKIVTLNKFEIQKRLLKTLDDLASLGCLTILVKLLKEDNELDILDAALAVANDVLNVLNEYKVTEAILPVDGELNVDEIKDDAFDPIPTLDLSDLSDVDMCNNSEEVLNGIINTDDMSLLTEIYESRMKLQDEKLLTYAPKLNLSNIVTPYTFVQFMNSADFKQTLEQKRKWKEGIKSVSSLLDDILGIYEINDVVNSLDCY